MPWDGIAQTLRAGAEPLQYAVFFSLLALLGAIEAFWPERKAGAERRRRWPANGGLTLLNVLVLALLPLGGVAVADIAAERGWGVLNGADAPPWLALAAGFLLRTLIGYGVHVAMHKVPLFWRVHRVHHSDPHLDVSTTVRFHPLEFLISTPLLLAGIAMLGIPALALIVYEIVDAAMAVFTHANVRLAPRLERVLSRILITPAMHRIHHSADPRETDSNYGATLSCWDILFGTFRRRSANELSTMQLGLGEWRDRRASSLGWLLALPFRSERAARALRASAS
jgi:sterol desaturase/sphingolipid hydroxylase (fatty acid hydroxylase superfamily)